MKVGIHFKPIFLPNANIGLIEQLYSTETFEDVTPNQINPDNTGNMSTIATDNCFFGGGGVIVLLFKKSSLSTKLQVN